VFEAGVVYLELRDVNVELATRAQGGADVILRLPVETAQQLGLQRYDNLTNPVRPAGARVLAA
jgi:hypothetical protein